MTKLYQSRDNTHPKCFNYDRIIKIKILGTTDAKSNDFRKTQ